MKLNKQCFIDRYDEDNLIYYEKDSDGNPGDVEFIYNWEYDLQRITGCGWPSPESNFPWIQFAF